MCFTLAPRGQEFHLHEVSVIQDQFVHLLSLVLVPILWLGHFWGTSRSLTADESLMLAAFVVHPELMVQIRYEEQVAEAKATGHPLPREPVTLIRQEARQNLRELFKNQLLPPYFWSRCRAIFEYVRQHGIDVLAHLPVPISGISATEIRWIENAITNPHKRKYMRYVCSRQDALLSGQALPTEPSVLLSSKERNQIRKVLEDLRAVMYFKERVAACEA